MWRGAHFEPTVAIVDSRSVKAVSKRGGHCGPVAGKRIKGRKQHIASRRDGIRSGRSGIPLVPSAGLGQGAVLIQLIATLGSIRTVFVDVGLLCGRLTPAYGTMKSR